MKIETKAQKRARKLARAQVVAVEGGLKLQRLTYCTKPGHDGCVNTEGSEHANMGWLHWCPACKQMHAIAVEHAFSNGAKWDFNGDMDRPTFSPSVKINWGPFPTVPEGRTDAGRVLCCHYFIRAGVIEYCGDCTHELKGLRVPLPAIPEKEL